MIRRLLAALMLMRVCMCWFSGIHCLLLLLSKGRRAEGPHGYNCGLSVWILLVIGKLSIYYMPAHTQSIDTPQPAWKKVEWIRTIHTIHRFDQFHTFLFYSRERGDNWRLKSTITTYSTYSSNKQQRPLTTNCCVRIATKRESYDGTGKTWSYIYPSVLLLGAARRRSATPKLSVIYCVCRYNT